MSTFERIRSEVVEDRGETVAWVLRVLESGKTLQECAPNPTDELIPHLGRHDKLLKERILKLRAKLHPVAPGTTSQETP